MTPLSTAISRPIPLKLCISDLVLFLRYSALNNGVTLESSCSRSLKVAPFDTPYVTYYWSAVVNIALSCTIF